ncbi:MAG: iron-containing alcohol dehydrogenase, partial [Hyphomicrobiales bacterium]|nr:iron-containing alcohol dehydrogenase [Hyphomicrobiales bacterium]
MRTGDETITVRVDLGPRSYDILIGPGLIGRTGTELSRLHPGIRAAIVTDTTVARLYLEPLRESLAAANISHTDIVLPPGEATKSFDQLAAVVDQVLAVRLERGDVVIALGGGVIGDLAGFVAGIVRRGMRFVQVPTTLLSQVDSSVGGKTGINTG